MRKLLELCIFAWKNGFINLFYKVKNHFQIWSIQTITGGDTKGTSITDASDHNGYSVLCDLAVKEDSTFKSFRSCTSIIDVLDHVTLEQGQEYISYLKLNYPHLLTNENIRILKQLDSIGDSLKYFYKGIGVVSPTLLRYMKVLGDLEALFGDLNKLSLGEIGVGFGGQSAISSQVGRANLIRLYDLPVVTKLARKFLEKSGSKALVFEMDGRNPEYSDIDLIISNYAFSELSRETQNSYLNNVILRCPRGYITWNSSSTHYLNGYSLADLLRIIPNSEIIPEIPLTSTFNSIVVWGHKDLRL